MNARRIYALVERMKDWPKVGHFIGSPPGAAGRDDRERLAWPRVVIIETNPDGSFALNRFSADGTFSGDTWHATLDEAKDQASYEYEDALSEWLEVPVGVTDAVSFALRQAQ
jgi:hypothetical protein